MARDREAPTTGKRFGNPFVAAPPPRVHKIVRRIGRGGSCNHVMDTTANELAAEADELRAIAETQDEDDAQEFFLALAEAYELLAGAPKTRRSRTRSQPLA